jgi:hypothetical protein
MVDKQSPFLAIKHVEVVVKGMLRRFDADMLEPAEKKAIADLKRLLVDTRLDIRDYELSETREEQIKCALRAKRQLQKLQKLILIVGSAFGPADVAQLSAQLDQISDWIR